MSKREQKTKYLVPDDLRHRLHFSDEQITEMCVAFDLVDRDRNGRITKQELEMMMNSLEIHPTENELNEMIIDSDKNKSGEVSFDEFIDFLCDRDLRSEPETEIRNAFRLFDKDNDGYLTTKDLKQVMLNLGEKMTDAQVEEMIREADLDKDGKINFEEFSRMMSYPVKRMPSIGPLESKSSLE